MRIKSLRYLFSYMLTFINLLWKKIKNLWNLILHFPANILTIISLLLLIYNLHLNIQNSNDAKKRWEEEISRKPVLFLLADSARVIASDTLFVYFSLVNTGNQTAKVQGLVLDIPTSYKLISENWMSSVSQGGIQQYSYTPTQTMTLTYSSDGVTAPSRTEKHFRFRLIKPTSSKFPLSISYVIFEEITGSQTGNLELPVGR